MKVKDQKFQTMAGGDCALNRFLSRKLGLDQKDRNMHAGLLHLIQPPYSRLNQISFPFINKLICRTEWIVRIIEPSEMVGLIGLMIFTFLLSCECPVCCQAFTFSSSVPIPPGADIMALWYVAQYIHLPTKRRSTRSNIHPTTSPLASMCDSGALITLMCGAERFEHASFSVDRAGSEWYRTTISTVMAGPADSQPLSGDGTSDFRSPVPSQRETNQFGWVAAWFGFQLVLSGAKSCALKEKLTGFLSKLRSFWYAKTRETGCDDCERWKLTAVVTKKRNLLENNRFRYTFSFRERKSLDFFNLHGLLAPFQIKTMSLLSHGDDVNINHCRT